MTTMKTRDQTLNEYDKIKGTHGEIITKLREVGEIIDVEVKHLHDERIEIDKEVRHPDWLGSTHRNIGARRALGFLKHRVYGLVKEIMRGEYKSPNE